MYRVYCYGLNADSLEGVEIDKEQAINRKRLCKIGNFHMIS